jgi:hypothetical protein
VQTYGNVSQRLLCKESKIKLYSYAQSVRIDTRRKESLSQIEEYIDMITFHKVKASEAAKALFDAGLNAEWVGKSMMWARKYSMFSNEQVIICFGFNKYTVVVKEVEGY